MGNLRRVMASYEFIDSPDAIDFVDIHHRRLHVDSGDGECDLFGDDGM